MSKRTSRQVKDIPQPRIEVTEHQVETKICSCGCVNTGLFPERVTAPVQYGELISALAVYLSVQQLIPEDRLQTLFSDVFDLNIATATLVGIQERCSEKISSQVDATLAELKVSEVKHLDETRPSS